MKKYFVIMLCVAGLTASALADIAVAYKSTMYFVDNGATDPLVYPDDYLPEDALHILIWSPLGVPAFDYAQPGTGVGGGNPDYVEYVLYSSNVDEIRAEHDDSRDDSGRFDYSGFAFVFNDSDVGGLDINSGYLYSRIFSTSNPAAGSWYYQSEAVQGPSLAEYVPLNPIILEHTTSLATGELQQRQMGVGTGMYQVIPEPATGVLALTALGMLIYRRRRSPLSAVRHRE
ncbi:MAG: PEP-CTERM sorting domain-containing protein [Kiritimatiellae bacterium]|nr:PEP-CTERM sorting domain-containing protein [Kiritimatiellia bacterium]